MVINDMAINQIEEQLKQLNENSYALQNCVIYPDYIYFSIGKKCVELLCLENYPCYIFCKYKNNNYIYLIYSIIGYFDKDSFINLISKCKPEQKCKLIKIKSEVDKKNLRNKSFDPKPRKKRNQNLNNDLPKNTSREFQIK